jgi:hypothetical protein
VQISWNSQEVHTKYRFNIRHQHYCSTCGEELGTNSFFRTILPVNRREAVSSVHDFILRITPQASHNIQERRNVYLFCFFTFRCLDLGMQQTQARGGGLVNLRKSLGSLKGNPPSKIVILTWMLKLCSL